ncbi:MAG TPA: hypothetical protein VH105_00520 [Burkholderiales bacterium]|jgi:hypothetical protein|nr:hypothetical protein [Burkholderiales bacterium]
MTKPMKTFWINGRLMQQQPVQQQQGGGKGGSAPAPPPPAPPPPPPVIEDTEGQAQDAERDLQNRRGAQSTDVTGPLGTPTPPTATKTLLGA